jgi:HSP20 family protein
MSLRELLPFSGASVPVIRGGNPIATFQDEVNKLFNDFFGDVSLPRWATSEPSFSMTPAMDVIENEKNYQVVAELPGMDIRDVQLTIADGYVTLKGEKKQEEKEEREGYYRQERSYGAFQRVVALPDTANFDKAEAVMKNGILTITLPKKAGAQSKERKLEIKQAA